MFRLSLFPYSSSSCISFKVLFYCFQLKIRQLQIYLSIKCKLSKQLSLLEKVYGLIPLQLTWSNTVDFRVNMHKMILVSVIRIPYTTLPPPFANNLVSRTFSTVKFLCTAACKEWTPVKVTKRSCVIWYQAVVKWLRWLVHIPAVSYTWEALGRITHLAFCTWQNSMFWSRFRYKLAFLCPPSSNPCCIMNVHRVPLITICHCSLFHRADMGKCEINYPDIVE